MASRAAVAAKYGVASASIDQSIAIIAKALGIAPPGPLPVKPRDLPHKQAMENERIAGFLAVVAQEVDTGGKAAKAVDRDAEQASAVTPEPGEVEPATVDRPLQPGDAPGTIYQTEADESVAEHEADADGKLKRRSKKSHK